MNKAKTNVFTKCFLASIALSVTSMTGAFAANQLADSTVLVLLAPHANRAQVYSDIANEAQSTVIHDFHVNREDYSVLHITPAAGQSAYENISKMMKNHPEIKSVSHNYMRYSPLRGALSTTAASEKASRWGSTYFRYRSRFFQPMAPRFAEMVSWPGAWNNPAAPGQDHYFVHRHYTRDHEQRAWCVHHTVQPDCESRPACELGTGAQLTHRPAELRRG